MKRVGLLVRAILAAVRGWWAWHPARTLDFPRGAFWITDRSICDFTWGGPRLSPGDGVRVPMRSGNTMLYRVRNVWSPHDPGDQHFYRVEPVRYLTPVDGRLRRNGTLLTWRDETAGRSAFPE